MSNDLLEVPGHSLHRLLAKGGMAEVYLAEQKSLGRKVALKILDQNSGDPDFVERFLKEARLVAMLNHPSIITIHDFGVLKDKHLFLSMEYMEGGDLDAKLLERISDAEALRILKELVKALIFIHSKGIIHRDIKPANILFRLDNSLALTDFGIAKQEVEDVKLTQAGTTVGSPAYCSPEQAQDLAVDHRSDIYSTGVLFLEMLLGRNPYKADSFVNTAINHIQMDIPKLQGEHKRFQKLIEKMLAKDPQDRFESAEQLLVYLETPENFYYGQAKVYSETKNVALAILAFIYHHAKIFALYCKITVYQELKKLTLILLQHLYRYTKQFAHYCKTTLYPEVKKLTIFILKTLSAYAKRFAIYSKATIYPHAKKLILFLLKNLYSYTKRFINYCRVTVLPAIKKFIRSLFS